MGATLCRLFMPNAFGGKARSDLNTSHIFPPGVLAAGSSPRRRGWSRTDEGWSQTRARAPRCSVAITALSRAGQVSSSRSRETRRVCSLLTLFPLSVCPSPFQQHPQLRRGAGLSRRVWSGLSQSRGTACGAVCRQQSGLPLLRSSSGDPLRCC